jgi:NADPH:quinone reductase-like Zn-dependent oxidoreductase
VKAIIHTRYGPPEGLQLAEIEKPVPAAGEVLVKVHAASLNAYDWRLMRAQPFLVRLMGGGFLRPKSSRFGADMAGRVEVVGRGVDVFQPGDAVYGDVAGSGAFAEYVAAPEKLLARKPAGATFAEAAAVPMAASTVLQGLRNDGNAQPGQKVLINGASGGVGTFAVQIAKALGAHVTAVCSTRKMEMTAALGADRVIDYTREDPTREGARYDLILAVNGYYPLTAYRRALRDGGTYVVAGGKNRQLFEGLLLGPLLSRMGSKAFKVLSATPNREDLDYLSSLIDDGQVTPVIDRTYPLDQVPDAVRYLEQGHAAGKVIISVASDAADR